MKRRDEACSWEFSVEGWEKKQEKWKDFQFSGVTDYTASLAERCTREEMAFVERVLKERQGLVVDVGTYHLGFIDALGIVPHSYVAIDPGLESPEEKLRESVSLRRGFAEDLPLEDQSARIVLFRSSMDHFRDAGAALQEARRVLEPGGKLLISVSNRHSALRVVRNVRDKALGRSRYDHFNQHMEWYTADHVIRLCRAAGFKTQEPVGVGYVPLAFRAGRRRTALFQAIEIQLAALAPRHGDISIVTASKAGT
jgi:SAM-dependent methyltransferase